MKLITPWLFAAACVMTASAYRLSDPVSPVSTALGGCYAVCPGSPLSIHDAAAECRLTAKADLLNLYGIPKLSQFHASLHYQTLPVTVGLTLRHFGLDGYGESAAGLVVGRRFSPFWAMSLGADWIHVAWPDGAKPVNTGTLNLETRFFPSRKITIGISVFNLSFTKFRTDQGAVSLPVHFRIGMRYDFSDQLSGVAEVDKELHSHLGVHAGCQYRIAGRVDLRLGLRVIQNLSPTGGIGVRFKRMRCDLGFDYDWRLGLQSSAGIQYTLP